MCYNIRIQIKNKGTYMKKILISITLLLAALLLCACGTENNEGDGDSTEGTPDSSVKMTATVTAIDEKIEVNVIESDYASGIYWVITSSETAFFDADGKEIKKADLAIGDTVEILYSGQVMMSLPPQIVAARITVL